MGRIAIDARELGGSGTSRYIEKLLYYLQVLDKSNDYIVLIKPDFFDKWTPTASNFTKIKCPHKEFTFAEQIGLLRQIRNLKVDLVHFPMVQQPILYRGKTVTTINDLTTLRFRNPVKNWLVFTLKREVYRFINLIVAHKASALLTYSKFVKDDITNYAHINSNKVTITYLAAEDLEGEPEPISQLQDKEFIMYTGRPQPHKNLYRLIEAFSKMREKHPKLLLVIAGKKDPSYNSYISYIERLGISDSVVFTDFIPDKQLKWAFRNTKAYIFPSLSEGFGLPGLEAIHYGAPLVCSNATCLPEVYGEAAHYFNPTNVNDMATKIDEVLSNPKLRSALVEKGKKQVKKYSWKRTAEQTLEVYKKILEEK
jgi:glycosyltransferase involved in cell wall biosynthesis